MCGIQGACTHLHAHYTGQRQQFAIMSLHATAVFVCFWTTPLTRGRLQLFLFNLAPDSQAGTADEMYVATTRLFVSGCTGCGAAGG